MEKRESRVEGVADLFKVLGKPDALEILFLTNDGIKSSTQTIEETAISQKTYYARLKALVDTGLVRKIDGVYGQTGLGRMVCDLFLPAMGKAVDARGELDFLVSQEGKYLDADVRKRIFEELRIPGFVDFTNVKVLRDYEALAIEAIDLYDSAEESVLLATNYLDARVMEAFLRAIDRGVTNRVIIGKNRQSSKIQNLRMMLSVTFAKTIISFASNIVELKDTVSFSDVPYTFCVVDGHRNLIEFSNPLNEKFIVALPIDDRGVGEELTKFFDMLWETGEFHSVIEAIDSLKPS